MRAEAAAVGALLGSLAAFSSLEQKPQAREWRTSALFEGAQLEVPKGPRSHMVEATAYCGCPECCGKWSTPEAITASGRPAKQGYTIATDWEVFPKGTCLEVGRLGKRWAFDTGSAIKGHKIDIFFDSHEEAKQFGRRTLEVKPC